MYYLMDIYTNYLRIIYKVYIKYALLLDCFILLASEFMVNTSIFIGEHGIFTGVGLNF